MRIGIMLRHLGTQRGGIGTYSRNLLDALLNDAPRHEFVLLYDDPGCLGSYSHIANVTEHHVTAHSRLLWDQYAVPRFIDRLDIDVVFNLKSTVPLRAHCKKVCVIHGGDWFAVPSAFPWYDRVYRAVLGPHYWKRADAIISVSQDATRYLIQNIRVNQQKIKTIYHGRDERFSVLRDTDRLLHVKEKFSLPGRFLFFAGQFYELKNLDRLIAGFLQVEHKIPDYLVITGEDRWGYLKRKRLENIRNHNRIFFLGWVDLDDLVALYNLAHAFVFPSLYEGFGIPLLEAMACGCPILSSTAGAIPEIAEDAAVLVDPYDVDAIANGIVKIATDAKCRSSLQQRGFRRVEQFSWAKCARETLGVLESVVP